MMILGLLLFVFVIYLLLNQNRASSVDVKTSDEINALEIAKVRLARGEIGVEEFEMIKKSFM